MHTTSRILVAVALLALPICGCSKQPTTPAPVVPAAPANSVPAPSAPAVEVKQDAAVNEPWEPAVDPARVPTRVQEEITVDDVGNAKFSATLQFSPAEYQTFKRMMSRPYIEAGALKWQAPRIQSALRYLDLEEANVVLENVGGTFEDDGLHLQAREIGWARHRDGRWVYNLSQNTQSEHRITSKAYQDGVPTIMIVGFAGKDAARQVVSRIQIQLPRGAHDIRIENRPNQLVYQLPAPASAAAGTGRAAVTIQAKPHIMAVLSKLYGDRKFQKLWIARALFRNNSNEILTDYRVRFRLAGFSEWSRWETSDRVLPGQTVVDAFYPAIDAIKVRELHGQTPVDVHVEYSYVRTDGKTVSDSTAERTKILGINEGVFSDLEQDKEGTWFEAYKDAPLVLGSFTSAKDPVMQDVVGMLSKTTSGAATAASDRAAIAFMKALYNLMRVNISYETTPGDIIDGLRHQHLKYGRDVLRTKSGTCVNTSIFYASVLEAAGLDACIWVVPGHAFAGAKMPESGKFVVVETTGCGGGTLESSLPFDKAMEAAQKTAAKWATVGLILEVNIRQLRRRGVEPPELVALGKNPLEEWKIKPPAEGPATERPAAEAPPPVRTGEKTAANFFKEGNELAKAKKWPEAQAAFTFAIARDKVNPEYYNSRALVYLELGDVARSDKKEEDALAYYGKAASDLATLLKIDPTFARAYNNAGVIFNRLGEDRKAIDYYTKAIALDPGNPATYRNRGKTWEKLGEKAKAQADFRAAAALD
jgi:tetratricopeptide (TPR) repeat protein